MDNEELIRVKLDSNTSDEEKIVESEEHFEKYLLFYLNKKQYALSAAYVREITITEDVYFLPFVPPYLIGLINRHGEPHAVIDLGIMIDSKKTAGNKFLIMNSENDRVAFIVSEIDGISNINVNIFNPISKDENSDNFFLGSVVIGKTDVLVINPDIFLDKIRNNLK